MHYRDQRALEIMRSKVNPDTDRVDITDLQLAQALGCHEDTARAIKKRLRLAGKIVQHGGRGRAGSQLEVVQEQ